MTAMRIDVEPLVDVGAADRPVIDAGHHGAARERSRRRIPERLPGEPSVAVAKDDRRPDVATSFACSLQLGAVRNPDQTLGVAQTDLRDVEHHGAPDVTRVVSRGLRPTIVDTVSRGVGPLDAPVLLPGDQEAIAVAVVQREHVARDHAASVRVARAAGAAQPGVTAVGGEAAPPGRTLQTRVLLDRCGLAPT